MLSKKSSPKTSVYKSAKTGKFVSEKYAKSHKETTFKQTIKKKK